MTITKKKKSEERPTLTIHPYSIKYIKSYAKNHDSFNETYLIGDNWVRNW